MSLENQVNVLKDVVWWQFQAVAWLTGLALYRGDIPRGLSGASIVMIMVAAIGVFRVGWLPKLKASGGPAAAGRQETAAPASRDP